jgi:hypothetical protein
LGINFTESWRDRQKAGPTPPGGAPSGAAAALLETEKNFRRIMGYQQLWMRKAFLDEPGTDQSIASNRKVGEHEPAEPPTRPSTTNPTPSLLKRGRLLPAERANEHLCVFEGVLQALGSIRIRRPKIKAQHDLRAALRHLASTLDIKGTAATSAGNLRPKPPSPKGNCYAKDPHNR